MAENDDRRRGGDGSREWEPSAQEADPVSSQGDQEVNGPEDLSSAVPPAPREPAQFHLQTGHNSAASTSSQNHSTYHQARAGQAGGSPVGNHRTSGSTPYYPGRPEENSSGQGRRPSGQTQPNPALGTDGSAAWGHVQNSGHPTNDRFWPEPGQTSPPPQSGPELDFTAPRGGTAFVPTTEPKQAQKRRTNPLLWIIPVVALTVIVGFGGIFLWQQGSPFGDEGSPTTSTGGERVLNRSAPPAWTTELAWYRDISTTPQIAVAQNRVAFFEDGRLTVLDADSGTTEFSSRPLQLSPNARPLISRVEGLPVVGAVDGANLTLWQLPAPNGASGTQISLALNAQIFTQSGGILVSTRDQHWSVSSDLTLSTIDLPTDHVALGVTGDGELLSAPQADSWTFTSPDGQSRSVRVQGRPEGTNGAMQVAWSSRGVVLAWGDMQDAGRRSVGFYEAATGELLAEGSLSAQQIADGLPLTVSEHGQFASAGPLLADLTTKEVSVVPGWSTVMSNGRGLYGSVNGSRQFWNGENDPVELEPGTGIPWGVSNSGLAIVLDTADNGQFALGGLRPKPD